MHDQLVRAQLARERLGTPKNGLNNFGDESEGVGQSAQPAMCTVFTACLKRVPSCFDRHVLFSYTGF